MIFTLAGVVIVLLVVALVVHVLLRWIENRGWLYAKSTEHAEPEQHDSTLS